MEREITESEIKNLQAVKASRPILNVFSNLGHAEVLTALHGHPEGLNSAEILRTISVCGLAINTQVTSILRKLAQVGLVEVYRDPDFIEHGFFKPRLAGRLTGLGYLIAEEWIGTSLRLSGSTGQALKESAEEHALELEKARQIKDLEDRLEKVRQEIRQLSKAIDQ